MCFIKHSIVIRNHVRNGKHRFYTPSMNNQRTTNLSFSYHTAKLVNIVCKSLN